MSSTPSLPTPPTMCRSCHQPSAGPCPRCTPLKQKQHNTHRAYYHTQEWRTLRANCIERDYHQCVICTNTHRLAAHHIVARKQGGADTLTNLATLCHSCHSKIEQRDQHTTRLLDEWQRITRHT